MSGGAVNCHSARSNKRFTVGWKIGSVTRFLISGRSLWLNNKRGCTGLASAVGVTLSSFTEARMFAIRKIKAPTRNRIAYFILFCFLRFFDFQLTPRAFHVRTDD